MDTRANPVAPVTDKPRRWKWLWIIASGFFLLLSLAFAVLWVRSYWCCDQTGVYLSDHIASIGSLQGGTFLDIQEDDPASMSVIINKAILGFVYSYNSEMKALRFVVPTWFLTFGSIMLASTPWLPWHRFRFSLKALMLFTTLVAVILGLGVWLVRG